MEFYKINLWNSYYHMFAVKPCENYVKSKNMVYLQNFLCSEYLLDLT